MNYRHIYHAGNFADVFKHIALMFLIDYLKQKDKPFFILDTHAGIGSYDLTSEQAQKTDEASEGIGKLWNNQAVMPDLVSSYLDLVRRCNTGTKLKTYPGSPKIAKMMLREGDRLVANELHPQDFDVLRETIGNDVRVQVMSMDGYGTLKALLPPPERRGLVLVDPPFEVTDEFERMVGGLQEAQRRWATGIYALWYPIKDAQTLSKFHEALAMTDIPKIYAADFYLRPLRDPEILNGCGMVFINPPWTLAAELNRIMEWLVPLLTGRQGRYEWSEIRGE